MIKNNLAKILIVEDDESIVSMIQYNLSCNGFQVITSEDGAAGYQMAISEYPDLILIDWMMPIISGIDLCKKIRSNPEIAATPIIMISARGEESDKIKGLNIGADDYITKPFSPKELVARINAILRRSNPNFDQNIIKYKNITLNANTKHITIDNKNVNFAPTEFDIIYCLVSRPDKVFSREQIIIKVWGTEDNIDDRTIDVHIGRIRKQLKKYNLYNLIKTVRSIGYSIEVNV